MLQEGVLIPSGDFPTMAYFKAGPFLILSYLIEYINLSDVIPIKIGFLRWQRYYENGFSGAFQDCTSHTSKKSVSQQPLSMSS